MQLDRVEYISLLRQSPDSGSTRFSDSLEENLLEALVCLRGTLWRKGGATIVGEAILDEINFSILGEKSRENHCVTMSTNLVRFSNIQKLLIMCTRMEIKLFPLMIRGAL